MSQPIKNHICEEQLFERLYKKHSKNLHDFLYYKFGDHLNPSDKVQEAFIKLWQNCGKVSPDKAKSFLFTTANNLMLNAVAHRKVVLKYEKLHFLPIKYRNFRRIMKDQQKIHKPSVKSSILKTPVVRVKKMKIVIFCRQ